MLKTGSEHVQSLKDGREVFINGQAVADVAEHPAFRRTVQSVGTLFDFAARSDNVDLMTFRNAGRRRSTGQPHLAASVEL
jgi:4-hydroxyphenylacetate 3-monooxygenase